MNTPSTIGEIVRAHAARDPSAVAILCQDLPPLSFEDLAAHIHRTGAQLRAAGIGPVSRVGLALPRGPEAALLSVAVCCSATLVPINPNLAVSELETEVARLRLDVLIVPADAALPQWAASVQETLGLFSAAKARSSFDGVVLHELKPVKRMRPAVSVTHQSWAALFKTSGTTGVSKRVAVTHANLVEMARKMKHWLALTPADRATCLMPIYYNAGFKATLLVPLLIGCSVALPASTGAHDLDRWLAKLRPTWLTAAPAFLQAVADRLRTRQERLAHPLRFVLSTASYLPPAIGEELRRLLGVPVVEFYGLCEAGMMTAPALDPDAARPGTVGRIPEGELAIRDDDGSFAKPGQPGQVVLRGPSVTPGYLMGDIESTPSGLEDGWLATGDIGRVDPEGFLTIVGRSKEIINRGGEKISPYDVEKALLAHQAVREAAAFAVRHPRLGENVGAAVLLQAGMSASSPELIDFIYDRLAPFQMPRHIHVVESLPVGPTGKISRPQLSALFGDHHVATPAPVAPLEILIVDIWQRLLERADIGMDDDFFEIGGDSLQATQMLLKLEEMTRHRILPSEVRAQLTVRQLAETLACAAAAKREVITRVRTGEGTPLFLCHGDFLGCGFYGFRLAELLETLGPVYILHSLLNPAEGVETIEQMVAHYLPQVEAVAPKGPVRLAGYCHGGLAAFELAGRLENGGRIVEKVVLIDTFSMNARPAVRIVARGFVAFRRVLPQPLAELIGHQGMPNVWSVMRCLLRKDKTILSRIWYRLVHRRPVETTAGQIRAQALRLTYYQAMVNYLPPRIATDVLCLLSDEYSANKDYAVEPWKRLASNVHAERIPGQHNTCVSLHLSELTACLNRMLGSMSR